MHTRSAVSLSAAAVLLLACEPDTEPPTASSTPDMTRHEVSPEIRRRVSAQLERFSTMPMLLAAERLDIAKVRGKSVKPRHNDKSQGAKKLTDVPVAADPNADENEPTVAANPKKKKLLVAGAHFITDMV